MNLQVLKQSSEAAVYAAVLIGSACFFSFTNPRTVPSIVLIGGFLLLFTVIYMTARLMLKIIGLHGRLTIPQYRVLTLGAAALPTFLLALQSIGQLTVRDVTTIALFFVIAVFYIMRVTSRQ